MATNKQKEYANIFEDVGNAEDMTGFSPSIPAGNHRLALVMYGPKASKQDDANIGIEAEFVILETDNEKARVGARHSWYWNISALKWTGKYAKDRSKKFLENVQQCIGSDDSVAQFGVSLSLDFKDEDGEPRENPEMLGLVIDGYFEPKFNADGTPTTFKKGGQVLEATWTPVSDQGEETFAEVRKTLAELAKRPKAPAEKPAAAKRTVATEPAEAPTPPPASTGATTARSLLGKKKAA